MKIAFFDIREDEKPILHKLKKKYLKEATVLTEIFSTRDALSLEAIAQLKDIAGISMLAGVRLDAIYLDALAAAGIRKVSLRCIGTDHVDMDYAAKTGIQIIPASYPPNAVADFTLMLMLLAVRKYKPALWRQQVNDYSLLGLQGRNLNTMKIGVIGAGTIGKQVLKNLSGFGCELYAYNRSEDEEVKSIATYVSLETLYQTCDMISVHVPLSPSTESMLDATALAKMKDGVILVNTSRGELMNIKDMIEGIENEKIGALAMDVFENDLSIYHKNHTMTILKNREMAYLRQFPNVILTQHMAFYTEQSVEAMVRHGIEGLL